MKKKDVWTVVWVMLAVFVLGPTVGHLAMTGSFRWVGWKDLSGHEPKPVVTAPAWSSSPSAIRDHDAMRRAADSEMSRTLNPFTESIVVPRVGNRSPMFQMVGIFLPEVIDATTGHVADVRIDMDSRGVHPVDTGASWPLYSRILVNYNYQLISPSGGGDVYVLASMRGTDGTYRLSQTAKVFVLLEDVVAVAGQEQVAWVTPRSLEWMRQQVPDKDVRMIYDVALQVGQRSQAIPYQPGMARSGESFWWGPIAPIGCTAIFHLGEDSYAFSDQEPLNGVMLETGSHFWVELVRVPEGRDPRQTYNIRFVQWASQGRSD